MVQGKNYRTKGTQPPDESEMIIKQLTINNDMVYPGDEIDGVTPPDSEGMYWEITLKDGRYFELSITIPVMVEYESAKKTAAVRSLHAVQKEGVDEGVERSEI